ncbi:MAG: YggS family pyridoxal phosphate-dependent enzyme [Gammaproteobacteria bacterium]|nr:YggS family pyridoxal phosphate-dependent enzyme [Gammaproteobacteria bacterium]
MTGAETNLADNLSTVQQKIQHCAEKVGRDVNDIRLIAVSKTRSLDEVKSIASLGQNCFAENTIQDAMSKVPFFNNKEVEWHFIGHLQSKKAGKIPGYFQWIHSLDSIKLAQKLSSAMLNNAKNSDLNCLIQVNVSGETSKFGLKPAEVKPFLQDVLKLQLPCLKWRGLMTIGVKGDEQQTRNAFIQLRELQQSCKAEFGLENFDQLSMGMSDDYCLAIEEGATMVRVGTSIFGQRN